MKIWRAKDNTENGSVLIASIFVGGILALALGSYLMIARAQYVSSMRSESWNSALTLAEAGVEEALAQLNPGASVNLDAMSMVNARRANNWGGGPSTGIYGPISRKLAEGSYTVAFSVATAPVIYSTGHVTIPTLSANLSRIVRVTTTNIPLFNAAAAVRSNITMTGTSQNFVFARSYDSSNPSGVTTNGDLLSLLGNISIGSSQVKGDLFLGPGSSGSSKVSGKTSHDLNADFNDAVLPDGSWLPPVGGNRTINGTTYQYVFGSSGDYSIATPGAIYVGPSAQVRLKIVSDNFAATAIKVAGTGSQKGKLTIYDNGTSFTLNGNADSDSNDPAALTYFGLPQNKGIVFNKNSYFTGTIYAPSANFTNNVLLRTQATFSGALTVNSIFINGLASFAFDEHLLKSQNLSRGYLVTSWREL